MWEPNKKYSKRKCNGQERMSKEKKEYLDEIDKNKDQIQKNNYQNLRDREQTSTQSEHTKINLEEKIQCLVKQLEDKDKQCKN